MRGRLSQLALPTMILAHTIAPALAHDWYDERTTADGEPCCGGKECAPLADGDVVEGDGGYLIRSLGITVPFAQVQPSPDGRFHACVWWIPKQTVTCFFGPLPGA